jgi:hypothetical protein
MPLQQFTKSLCAAAATAVVASALFATNAAAGTLDLSKPADAHQAMLRLVGDLDGKPVFKDWDVTIFAVLPGAKPRPILRMQGFNAGRLIAKPDGSHDWVPREVSYYQDLKSGEIIESWVNPLNNQKQCIVPVANDPVSNHMVPPMANGRAPGFNISGETGSLRMDILPTRTPFRKRIFPKSRPGRPTWHLSTSSSSRAADRFRRAALDPRPPCVVCTGRGCPG